jgi:hypothetical protein
MIESAAFDWARMGVGLDGGERSLAFNSKTNNNETEAR